MYTILTEYVIIEICLFASVLWNVCIDHIFF